MTHRFIKTQEFTDGIGIVQPRHPYGNTSQERLQSCDHRLVQTFWMVAEHVDVSIIVGHRDEAAQHAAFVGGKSKLDWPNSKHNEYLSNAVDAALYPIQWGNTARQRWFAGFVVGVAATLGPEYELRWGGDWDNDPDTKKSFEDLWHFELKRP